MGTSGLGTSHHAHTRASAAVTGEGEEEKSEEGGVGDRVSRNLSVRSGWLDPWVGCLPASDMIVGLFGT